MKSNDERHRFTPSRPDGVVCIVQRRDQNEVCGYPAGHPIHTAAAARPPAEAITGISDRAAAALVDLAELRMRLRREVYSDEMAMFDRIEAALREAGE